MSSSCPGSFGEEFDGIGGEGQGEMDMSWEDGGQVEQRRRVLEAQIVEVDRQQQIQRQKSAAQTRTNRSLREIRLHAWRRVYLRRERVRGRC